MKYNCFPKSIIPTINSKLRPVFESNLSISWILFNPPHHVPRPDLPPAGECDVPNPELQIPE
jgi:hypothetical protein